MSRRATVSELMTKRVRTLGVDAKLSEARRALSEERIHHLPVVEGGKLVGVLSSRDLVRILREAKAGGAQDVDAILDRASSVREAMTPVLVALRPDDPVRSVPVRLGRRLVQIPFEPGDPRHGAIFIARARTSTGSSRAPDRGWVVFGTRSSTEKGPQKE